MKLNRKLWNSQFYDREEKAHKYSMYCKWNEKLVIKDLYIYKEIYLWFRILFSIALIIISPLIMIYYSLNGIKLVFESVYEALFKYASSNFTDIKSTNKDYIKED